MSGGMMLSGHATSAWFVGLGGGVSKLSPDTAGSAFTLEEEQGQAATAYFGLDINNWLSAEAAFTDLGAAGLSGEQEIAYTAASVGGIAYVYNNRGMDGRQAGLSGYVRFGLSSITNESRILLNEADNTALWVGAGVQYPIGARLGLRAEVASYDGDAQIAMASIYWRSKDDGGGRVDSIAGGQLTTPSVESSDVESRNGGYAEVEAFEGYDNNNELTTHSDNGFGAAIIDPETASDTDNVDIASSAECNAPALGEPSDGAGCALFTGVVEGVEFQMGSSRLTPNSEYLLESLALSLNNNPALVIELQVHTEAYQEQGQAMQISRERVLTVARFLAGQGVDTQRLRARAFGSAQPLSENNSVESRRLNNRVALRVL
ncbi:MAG: outer membrane protein OmpA-like peptidoglycan-associated protein [Halioglobus sp.]|jgi:outer membrane protein OmpA-like peptidoglycan-associated protein